MTSKKQKGKKIQGHSNDETNISQLLAFLSFNIKIYLEETKLVLYQLLKTYHVTNIENNI